MKGTALVTGASSGIGCELARMFAADGWSLVLLARSAGRLQALGAELAKAHGVAVEVLVADLAEAGAPERIVAELDARRLVIDALVNNAGFGGSGPFATTDLATEREMIAVNVVAPTALTKLLLPGMLARRRGWVLNVASTAAFQPGPLMAVYYATKAYLLSFSEAIADELRRSGVRVTTVCPGPTASGFAGTAGMERSRLFRLKAPMTAAEVARQAYRGLLRGRRLVVPGLWNKLLVQSVRIAPRRLVTAIARKLQESS